MSTIRPKGGHDPNCYSARRKLAIVENDCDFIREVVLPAIEAFNLEVTQFSESMALLEDRTSFMGDGLVLNMDLLKKDVGRYLPEFRARPRLHVLALSAQFDEETVRNAGALGAIYTCKRWDVPSAVAALGSRLVHRQGAGDVDDRLCLLQSTHRLTVREMRVLELWLSGLQHKDIAERLAISYRTVGAHLANIAYRCNRSLANIRVLLLSGNDAQGA